MRWLYVAPAAALLLAVVAVPLAASIPGGLPQVGEVLRDSAVAESAVTTLLFAAVSVGLELVLGLSFALALDQAFRLRGAARAVALLPWTLPTAVMAMSWRLLFNDTYGVTSFPWLARPWAAFAALVIADVWKTTPFVMLLLLAGLQSIPRELNEAMSLDGAGPVRRFFMITLPLLRPALSVALAFRLIQALGMFDLAWVLTGGGPGNSTRTIAMVICDHYFRFGQPARGAAVTLVAVGGMFAVVAAVGTLSAGRRRT